MGADMTAHAGWYPDEHDPRVTRYWDGGRWTEVMTWNGTAWVAVPPPPPAAVARDTATPPVAAPPAAVAPDAAVPTAAAPPVAVPTPAVTAPPAIGTPARADGQGNAFRPSLQFVPNSMLWLVAGGAVGVALSAVLPWVSVSGFGVAVSSSPQSGAPVLFILLAAGVMALAWPTTRAENPTLGRRIGVSCIVGLLAIAVVTNWSELADLQDETTVRTGLGSISTGVDVSAGIGLYLYTVAVVVLVVATVRMWLAARRTAT
jgi:hypothetical protein